MLYKFLGLLLKETLKTHLPSWRFFPFYTCYRLLSITVWILIDREFITFDGSSYHFQSFVFPYVWLKYAFC